MIKKNQIHKSPLVIMLVLLGIFFLTECNYDKAVFKYNDIIPDAPKNLSVTVTNTTDATVEWGVPLEGHPSPSYIVFSFSSNVSPNLTNQINVATNIITNVSISGLSSKTFYSVFVRATNRAGHKDSSTVSFKTK